jgi:exonuclease III
LEKLNDSKDNNRASENIKENIKTSAEDSLCLQELKQHKARFDREHLGFLDPLKQAQMQWLQNTSQSNVDKINNIRGEGT